jgi:hypothetical protein
MFLPFIGFVNRQGRREEVLSLAVVNDDDNGTCGYTDLGEIDEQGFLRVYGGIPEDDAWEVFKEARGLQALKTGTADTPPELPQLQGSLLAIFNPHTAILVMPPKPTQDPSNN